MCQHAFYMTTGHQTMAAVVANVVSTVHALLEHSVGQTFCYSVKPVHDVKWCFQRYVVGIEHMLEISMHYYLHIYS